MSDKDIADIIEWLKRLEARFDRFEQKIDNLPELDKRVNAVEVENVDNSISIAKSNNARFKCEENHDAEIKIMRTDVNNLKASTKPLREAIKIGGWVKSHKIAAGILLVLCACAIIGVVVVTIEIFHRWPVGASIGNITLSQLWDIIINHKK